MGSFTNYNSFSDKNESKTKIIYIFICQMMRYSRDCGS